MTAPTEPDRNGQRWRSLAACRDMDPDLFFPDDRSVADAAIRVCESCPVMDECAGYADRERICGYPVVGVWGGRWRRPKI